jgi:nitroreductase/Pyruvate/2-oxoacid:ferredoxin oxidoreductase delta subunit
MITLLTERCSSCGLCADLCHENCISMTEAGPRIDLTICSTCTQCIAACPTRALAWNGSPPTRFERRRLPTAEQLEELFKERRSIRRFKPVKIAPALLEEIAQFGIYAPTHDFNLRVIVIDDANLIAALDHVIVDNCRWIHRLAFRFKTVQILANWFGYGPELRRARPKIETTLQRGHSFHSMPAAFIFVIGSRKSPLSEVSAQYAMANMMYYAQIKGVGVCMWANGPIFIDKHRTARQLLKLRPTEHIYAAMYMGYPAVRFSNKNIGKTMAIQWNMNALPVAQLQTPMLP